MGTGFVSPEGLTSDLEQLERDARALRKALDDVRATGEAADGLVVATVNGRGELVELTLDPRIYRAQDSDALAADVLAAVRQGASRATEEVVRAAKRLLPESATAENTDVMFDPFLHQVGRAKGRTR